MALELSRIRGGYNTHTHIYIYTKRDVNEMEKIKQNNEIKQVKT